MALSSQPKAKQRPPRQRAPKRGDIITIDFSPAAGREMIFPHPALVMSADDYNAHARFVVVLAITTVGRDARENHLAVNLMGYGTQTTGVIICDKPRSLDLEARRWKLIEAVPKAALDEATTVLAQVLGI